MTLKFISGPALEPITLAEAKLHLRVDNSAEDALITAMVVAVRRQAEHELGRALITQTWEQVLDCFPAVEIELPKPRVLAITSVKYVDFETVEQTLDPSAYALDADNLPGWLLPASATVWPTDVLQDTTNAVRVRFTAGYGPLAADVPANVVAWMLLQLGALYRNREAFQVAAPVAELPNRFTAALLDGERIWL